MNSENRQCQNCKQEFVIEPDDFAFYEKIKVPVPTFCRECRQRRRMSFRNERNLYKRKCDVTGKNIISIFPPKSPYKVCDNNHWYSDQFDPFAYGRDFDFSRPFFEQFHEFSLEIPLPSLRVENSVNCAYNNDMSLSQNCYLCSRTHSCHDMAYTYRGNFSSYCIDCMQVVKASEYLYESVECVNCQNSIYLYFAENCANSAFLWNCRNCLDCFMSSNLRNKQYCFMNKQLTKNEYKTRIKDFDLASFSSLQRALAAFEQIKQKTIRKNLTVVNSYNVKGDNIIDCKNAYMCFGVGFCEGVRYLWDIMKYKDSMDAYSGGRNSQLIYECTAVAGSYGVQFCLRASDSREVQYSYFINGSKNIFGCIGLRNKEHCIFNKQHSKDEYRELVSKIITHMKSTGEYGEFFPTEISPFAYNDTIAQEYFSLTKEQVLKRGYSWNDPEGRDYEISIKPQDLPDHIKDIDDSILKETISCEHEDKCNERCTTAFKIIPDELKFYKKMNLPLPRLCPNCRHYRRLKQRNPLKLWHRQCVCDYKVYNNSVKHPHHLEGRCPNEFETSYAPERKEIVYCEECYNAEVV